MTVPTLAIETALQRAANPGSAKKSVILIGLGGGPSHVDMYDLKPNAPAEKLLQAFDTLRRDLDTRGEFKAADEHNARALEMILSPKVRDAFDVAEEPEPIRAKYVTKGGQVVGETDSRGENPRGRPFSYQNIAATIYHTLGIDPSATIPDYSGRPMFVLEEREPVAELL